MKRLLIGILLIGLNISAFANDSWQMPGKDRDEVVELVKKVIKLGVPNARGKELYSGIFEVEIIINPRTEEPPLPMQFCVKQSTGTNSPNKMIYWFRLEGLHLKDKQGNWLVNMTYPFIPDINCKLVSKKMKKVDVETLQADAMKKVKFDAERILKDWLSQIDPKQRQALISSLNLTVPVFQYVVITQDEFPIALICLQQMGFNNAPLFAYAIADRRASNYWQLKYWSEEPSPYDPTGKYPGLQKMADEWADKQKSYKLESPAVAFRRSLHRLFRHILINSLPVLSPKQAEELCLATLDPGDPQGLSSRIKALAQAMVINPNPKEGASLKIRLQAWGIPSREPDFRVYKGTTDKKEASIGLTTAFIEPKQAYNPNPEDLDQLFKLLDDDSPSRFIDYQGARTVGDNALRAIAIIMEQNPLELVDMAALEPWTKERQRTAAKKLQEWWTKNKNKYNESIKSLHPTH